MAKNNYKELVAQAEQAVSSVSDPSLKQIAFQKVLDDLLKSSQEDDEPTPLPRPLRHLPKRSARAFEVPRAVGQHNTSKN